MTQPFTSVPYEINESIHENNGQTIFFLLIFVIIMCFFLYYLYYIKKPHINGILVKDENGKQDKQDKQPKNVRFANFTTEYKVNNSFQNIEKRMTDFKDYLKNYINKIIFYLYTDKNSIKTTQYSSKSSIHHYMNK